MPKREARKKLAAALNACGAVLERRSNHLVYRLPSGQIFVTSATTSDFRSEARALSDLRRILKEGSCRRNEHTHVANVKA